jgi:hypothetical protein
MMVLQHAALHAQQQHTFWQDNFILLKATMPSARVSIAAPMKKLNTYNLFDAPRRFWLRNYFM